VDRERRAGGEQGDLEGPAGMGHLRIGGAEAGECEDSWKRIQAGVAVWDG
jgi:hypothetical protein